ncbi:Di-copper centre-containing protein [Parathielavia hyrcaniae]|uniref:Di-copper centre-containing protein n=1 Tax=Parathielavia hyrcaniae TaxID=113614 RepID=A0AAN6SZ77_9PEZI|nr:Di-copper centre-containing protein [Parathielavia hyrcaniae]
MLTPVRDRHTFSRREKRDYIEAELCLMELPATLGLPGARNRFEELQSVHQHQTRITHRVGAFLPFHRLLMYAHEHLLREECGYRGAQPYWDETRDAGRFTQSVVLEPITGFGGDGMGDEGCIADGPFANYTNNLGPGYRIEEHCIYRSINDTLSRMASQRFIDECNEETTFEDFWPCSEQEPHNGGHAGIGGKMLDPIASPGDPIFYLHHTFLDKVYWDWQARDLPARLTEIGGQNTQAESWTPPPPDALVPPPDWPPQVPQGDPGNVTTLSHILNMWGVIEDAVVADVMDIRGPLLCYEYV